MLGKKLYFCDEGENLNLVIHRITMNKQYFASYTEVKVKETLSMDYGAISIDTSIFDQNGLKLESGLLKTLTQFKGKHFYLVLSEIVVKEVHVHLKKKAAECRRTIVKAIRESTLNHYVSMENADRASEILLPKEDDNEVAKKRMKSFLESTGAQIVLATGRVELNEIIIKYFRSEPPFAESGKKKNEFPDAIALMSLESWAKEHKIKILAVAKDGDWHKFAENSNHIDVVEDLSAAIAKFQPHSAAIDFCNLIAKKLPNREPGELYESISQYLSDSVEEMEIYAEASSPFIYDSDIVEVALEEFEFLTDSHGNALLQTIQGQNQTLIVEAKVCICGKASTSFSLSVRDSIDKDYVLIGSASAVTKLGFESEILLTFEGDFEDDIENVELIDFELLSYPNEVDFGDIEPDYWHEDE